MGGVVCTLVAWAVLLLVCGCWAGFGGGLLGLPLYGGNSLTWSGTAPHSREVE